MVKWYELDWRMISIRRIFKALSTALDEVTSKPEELVESHMVDDALEHIESLLGIAFVTAQTYITGAVADVNRLSRTQRFSKEELLKINNDKLPNSDVSKMELCDAIANYFKHHDEWGNWSAKGRHQKTIAVLRASGIVSYDEFPCRKAADIIWSNKDGANLKPLLTMIVNWRKEVIAACTVREDNV